MSAPPPLVAAVVLALGGCVSVLDPDDCTWAPEGACERYLPEGTLCGLQHTEYFGVGVVPGSTCVVDKAVAAPAEAERGEPACQEGFRLAELVDDDESEGNGLATCVAEGNPETSSAAVRDLPLNSACGFNTVGDRRRTRNLCQGLDPAVDGCPANYELRFALDGSRDCHYDAEWHTWEVDTTRGPPSLPNSFVGTNNACPEDRDYVNTSHLLYWCELVEEGCVGAECASDFTPVCGLTPAPLNSLHHGSSIVWWEVRRESPGLADAASEKWMEVLESGLDDTEISHTCQGQTLPWNECPEGWEVSCAPDCRGLNRRQRSPDEALCGAPYTSFFNGGWCWCAPEGTGNNFRPDELLTDRGGDVNATETIYEHLQ